MALNLGSRGTFHVLLSTNRCGKYAYQNSRGLSEDSKNKKSSPPTSPSDTKKTTKTEIIESKEELNNSKGPYFLSEQQKLLTENWERVKKVLNPGGVASSNTSEWYYKKVSFWMKRYEDFVGLTEVKVAQARVVEAETKFIQSQELRRETQSRISEMQAKIKAIHAELEKTYRGEDRYLTLVTEEHALLKEERSLMEQFKLLEKAEREYFAALSNSVRDSHEKERAQAEKTKYWSVIGSVIGTCIGIIGTTINNRMRMKELRQLVTQNSSGELLHSVADDISKDMKTHEDRLQDLVSQISGTLTQLNLGMKDSVHEMIPIFESIKTTSAKLDSRHLEELIAETLIQQAKDVRNGFMELHGLIKNDFRLELGKLEESAKTRRQKEQERLVKAESENKSLLKKYFDNVDNSTSNIFKRTSEIDEKVKDVRSLLLAQSISSKTKRQVPVPSGLDDIVDKIEVALEERESRTVSSVIFGTAVAITVITPIVTYIVNKLLL